MKGLIVAIQFLTRLPMPRVMVSDDDFARSMRWFPAVGLIVGAIVAAGLWTGAAIDPWVGALIGLALWVAVTGALHLDGLGDIADAMGAVHKSRTKLLAALADPHVGSFAVVAILLQLLAKLILLHALAEAHLFAVLVVIPAVARLGPLVWTRQLPPLHRGLAARFEHVVRPIDIGLWSALLLGAAWSWPALIVAPALLFAWAIWVRRRLGGISGDGHGAGIELVETGLLLAALVAAHLG